MRYMLMVVLFSLTLFAQEVSEQSEPLPNPTNETVLQEQEPTTVSPKESPIKALIEQIQNAKSDDRRVLMNQLKIQLRASNQEQKHKTMMALKEAFSKHENHSQEGKHLRLRLHQGDKNCNMNQEQSTHQPKFRHLQRQREQGEQRERSNPNHNPPPNRGNQGEGHK